MKQPRKSSVSTFVVFHTLFSSRSLLVPYQRLHANVLLIFVFGGLGFDGGVGRQSNGFRCELRMRCGSKRGGSYGAGCGASLRSSVSLSLSLESTATVGQL